MLEHFYLAPGLVNLNHGSYGSVCKRSETREHSLNLQMESDPNTWFKSIYSTKMNEVRNQLSGHVNGDEHNLVLVENASAGINAVLRSVNLQRGDKVLYMNIAYPMVKNVLSYLEERIGIIPIMLTINFPVSTSADFLDPVSAALEEHGSSIKLACLDHISSFPTCVLPIKELISLCHQYSVPVMVDGAHVLGNIPLDLNDINPDYYISNANKWLYSPKGSAILWVRTELQVDIVPTVISSEFAANPTFVSRFEYTGTRNYNAMLAINEALAFRAELGEDAIIQYNRDLAWEGASRLKDMWNTELLAPREMNSALVNVRLPTDNATLALIVKSKMFSDYNTYINVSTFKNQQWIRLSGQIYLELSDILLAGSRVLNLIKTLQKIK